VQHTDSSCANTAATRRANKARADHLKLTIVPDSWERKGKEGKGLERERRKRERERRKKVGIAGREEKRRNPNARVLLIVSRRKRHATAGASCQAIQCHKNMPCCNLATGTSAVWRWFVRQGVGVLKPHCPLCSLLPQIFTYRGLCEEWVRAWSSTRVPRFTFPS